MTTQIKQPLVVDMFPRDEGGWASTELDPPPPPIDDLSVNAGSTSAVLSWTPVGQTVAVWRRNVAATQFFTQIQSGISGEAISYNDTGLTPSTEYQWKLVTDTGESNVVTATTLAGSGLTVIFEDDFEGASASQWTSATRVDAPATLPAETGRAGKGRRFRFLGNPPGQGGTTGPNGSDAHAELRFDLGALYSELTIEFDLWIPSNYKHRLDGSTNNKFFRAWHSTYSSLSKIGASLVRGSDDNRSTIGSDYVKPANTSMSTAVMSASNYISPTDRAVWIAVKIEIRAPTPSTPGMIRIYKNGSVFLTDNAVPYRSDANGQNYRYGYLLGWANSGFAEDTYIWMDNAKFSQGIA